MDETTIDEQKLRLIDCNARLTGSLQLPELYLALQQQIKTLSSLELTFDQTIEADVVQIRTQRDEHEYAYFEDRSEEYFKAHFEKEVAMLREKRKKYRLLFKEEQVRCSRLELQLRYEREYRDRLRSQEMSVDLIKVKKQLTVARNTDVWVKYEQSLLMLEKLISGWENNIIIIRTSLEVEMEQKYKWEITQKESMITTLKTQIGELQIKLQASMGSMSVDVLDGAINEYEQLLGKIPSHEVVSIRGEAYGTYGAHGTYGRFSGGSYNHEELRQMLWEMMQKLNSEVDTTYPGVDERTVCPMPTPKPRYEGSTTEAEVSTTESHTRYYTDSTEKHGGQSSKAIAANGEKGKLQGTGGDGSGKAIAASGDKKHRESGGNRASETPPQKATAGKEK